MLLSLFPIHHLVASFLTSAFIIGQKRGMIQSSATISSKKLGHLSNWLMATGNVTCFGVDMAGGSFYPDELGDQPLPARAWTAIDPTPRGPSKLLLLLLGKQFLQRG